MTFVSYVFFYLFMLPFYAIIIQGVALHLMPNPLIDAKALTTHLFGVCNDLPDSDVSPPISRQTFLSPGVASDDDT